MKDMAIGVITNSRREFDRICQRARLKRLRNHDYKMLTGHIIVPILKEGDLRGRRFLDIVDKSYFSWEDNSRVCDLKEQAKHHIRKYIFSGGRSRGKSFQAELFKRLFWDENGCGFIDENGDFLNLS